MSSCQDTALVEDTEQERRTPLAIMQVGDFQITKYDNDDIFCHLSLSYQGYMTILTEFMDQVDASSPAPTHVFLQAGVGSFSGSLSAHLQHLYPAPCTPRIVIVEPRGADCCFRSAQVS